MNGFDMNEAEVCFEEYCRQEKIAFQKIEEGKSKSPDYELSTKAGKVIVEIKGFEHAHEDDVLKINPTPSLPEPLGLKRIREKMKDSSRQFIKYQESPTLLILRDTGKSHVDLSTKILKMAMFGDISYVIPLDLEGRAEVDGGHWQYGRNAPPQVTRKIGGSWISAVAVLEKICINEKIMEKHCKAFSQQFGGNWLKNPEIPAKVIELLEDIKAAHPDIDFNESKWRLRIICNPFSKVPFPSHAFNDNWNEIHMPNFATTADSSSLTSA